MPDRDRVPVTRRAPALLAASLLTLGATIALRAAPRQASPPSPARQAPVVDFARDVQPILEKHCYECHGAKKVRGKLRMHVPELLAKGGTSGPAFVPGDPDHSLIVRRLLGLDGEDQMPLDADPLSEAELTTIKGWIAAGASLPAPTAQTAAAAAEAEHWSYVKPVRPPLPTVSREVWTRTPIDRFVLARLDREKLTPAPEADRLTLLRRVSLDLTGLPPTIEEMDAVLADTRPDAYDRVVDRLLASPHYGERWARPWLDLARYADSHGYEKDALRTMWRYRDWVIDALNRDLPFDQFTIEQIAGDMLPGSTDEQKVASGFNRNTLLNQEGGIDVEEARWETLVDRVNTTGTVWLGSTIACAQCHDLKYDAISQR